MPIKDVLVYADAGAAAAACLDLAAGVAAQHDARLTALHVISPPVVPVDFGGGATLVLMEAQERFQREQADKARAAVEAARSRSGMSIEYREAAGPVADIAVLHARYADLVVVGQAALDAAEAAEADVLPEEIAMAAGRPVLVVPRYGRFEQIARRVLVAWNRSREATRAVHDALPILTKASSVTIMEVEPADSPRHIAGADIAAHLARHGVRAEVSSTPSGSVEVGDIILSRVADLGSDLLVMGAYGHSRLREFVLGGATRHILGHMTVPVLMSH